MIPFDFTYNIMIYIFGLYIKSFNLKQIMCLQVMGIPNYCLTGEACF